MVPPGVIVLYFIELFYIALHYTPLNCTELFEFIFVFVFFFNWVYADVLKVTCSTDHSKERNLIHIKKVAKNSPTVTKE